MIQFFIDAWHFLMEVLSTAPLGFWTVLLSFFGSALLTQRAKFWLPIEWTERARALLTQSIAFWSALVITWLLWPTTIGLIAGGCVGIASPTMYAILVRVIGLKWPDLRDLLSQDVRP